MAAITLQGVSKTLASGRLEAHLAGSEGGARRGATTFAEDLPAAAGGAVRALDGVDLDVRDGETLAVIGPSGGGKSTLLRIVAGLEAPDSGRVLYDGQDMGAVPPGERGIGMVFQNYALYPHMESRGNLGFSFRIRRRQEAEIDERVRVTAEIMGLGFAELLDRRPGTLSGGQQQRVAIGRCIARDPRLFLLDEPLSSLDARLRARTRVELKRLLTRFKITTLYVTHDQTEAIALAGRIAVLRRGRIEQVGTWRELYDAPASAFVAGFVGTPGSPPANLLPGELRGAAVAIGAGRLPLPAGLAGAPPGREGQAVLVGLRPEGITVAALDGAPAGTDRTDGSDGTDGSGALVGVVEAVEPLIADRARLIHVALAGPGAGPGAVPGGGAQAAGVTVTARVPLEPALERGQRVALRADPNGVLLFDAGTGLALGPPRGAVAAPD